MNAPSHRTRRACLAALVWLAAGASAGTAGAAGTAPLTSADILIVVQSPQGSTLLDAELQRFFNIANCNCQAPVSFLFTLSQSGLPKKSAIPAGTIDVWIGTGCDTVANQSTQCQQLGSLPLASLAGGGPTLETDAQTLSQLFLNEMSVTTPTTGGGVCASEATFAQSIYALITFAGDPAYDVVASTQVEIDLSPPPAPPPLTVAAGGEALDTSWTDLDPTAVGDLAGYQLLCDRGGALQVFKSGTFAAGFQTCRAAASTPTDVDANINALDPDYACSPLLGVKADSYRIRILQDGVTYGAAVVAIDKHQNASQPAVSFGTPVKALSFYDSYRDDTIQPGGASGGFCAIGPGPIRMTGRASIAGLAGWGLGLGLIARRRRRRR